MIASFVHQLKFAVTAVACCAALAPVAHAQDSYPSRPTRLVVGFSPGGPVDVGARLLGEHLSRTMGTTFLVENRVGANAMIAAESVKRAAPDGYTVFVSSSSAITLSPVLHKNTIRYNPEEDFAPVATIMEMPLILVVNNNDPKMKSVRTLQDLVELAKKNPGQITYGSAGPGNITQIAFEVLSSRAGIQMVHIPYKGTASAQSAILANEVNMVFDSLSVMAHIKSGAVRPLAISSNRRLAELPDVPTVQEAGYGVGHRGSVFARRDPLGNRGRDVAGEVVQQGCRVVVDGEHGAMLRAHEGFIHRVIQELTQQVVIAGDIEQAAWLLVHAQLRPGPDFEDLFQRARAAGQGDETVGLLRHQRLALVHRLHH
ncbi:tripartite tricarboxylate transporter family receptor, partial [Bordetella bronchiseptica B20-10725633]